MALSARTKEILVVALADRKAAEELIAELEAVLAAADAAQATADEALEAATTGV